MLGGHVFFLVKVEVVGDVGKWMSGGGGGGGGGGVWVAMRRGGGGVGKYSAKLHRTSAFT